MRTFELLNDINPAKELNFATSRTGNVLRSFVLNYPHQDYMSFVYPDIKTPEQIAKAIKAIDPGQPTLREPVAKNIKAQSDAGALTVTVESEATISSLFKNPTLELALPPHDQKNLLTRNFYAGGVNHPGCPIAEAGRDSLVQTRIDLDNRTVTFVYDKITTPDDRNEARKYLATMLNNPVYKLLPSVRNMINFTPRTLPLKGSEFTITLGAFEGITGMNIEFDGLVFP